MSSNDRIVWTAALFIFSMLCGAAASRAADPPGNSDKDPVLKALRSYVPHGWTVERSKPSGRPAADGTAYYVTSPNEMPLEPSPAGNLPFGDRQGHCTMLIWVGKRLSADEQARRWKEDKQKQHYQSEPQVWLPEFHDSQYGYHIESPPYCPKRDSDKKSVVECFKAIAGHLQAYSTTSLSDEVKQLDSILNMP